MRLTLGVIESIECYMATGGDTQRPGYARRSAARHQLAQVNRQLATLIDVADYERDDDAAANGLAGLWARLLAERRRLLALLGEAVWHG